MKRQFNLVIELVSSCNLSCPSCPQGRKEKFTTNKRLTLDLFNKILDKLQKECHLQQVLLYSWTEPFLHPELPLFITAVKNRGLTCILSTNLNYKPYVGFVPILDAKPDVITMSMSGLTPETYNRNHKGGDIDTVLKHSAELSKYKHDETTIIVSWHSYKSNKHEEDAAKHLFDNLGFVWNGSRGAILPVEKVLAGFNGKLDEIHEPDNLLTHPTLAAKIFKKFRWIPCPDLYNSITIDAAGKVNVCCSVYKPFISLDFLTTSLADIQKAKHSSGICKVCKKAGAHAYIYDVNSWKRALFRLAHFIYSNTLGCFVSIERNYIKSPSALFASKFKIKFFKD